MRKVLIICALMMMVFSTVIFLTIGQVSPVDRNIIYIHVPASACALLCFVILFACSIVYLKNRNEKWDCIAAASGEVGFIFATALNVTGMIFARAEWGVWWTPSVRLISSAILWFLYAAYLILRSSFENKRKRAVISAVFGIIGFIDVPIVYISARFIRDIHRPNFSFDTSWQNASLGLSILATVILAGVLIWIRSDLLRMEEKINLIRE